MGLADQLVENLLLLLGHAKALYCQLLRGSVEDSDDDPFAILGRQGRYTQFDALVSDFHLNPAVLRQSLFGNIHIRHNFNAAQNRWLKLLGQIADVLQSPIEPVSDLQVIRPRLEVDIAGSLFDGFLKNQIDSFDHRRLRALPALFGQIIAQIRFGLHLDIADSFFYGGDNIFAPRAIDVIQSALNPRSACKHRSNPSFRAATDGVDSFHIHRVVHRDGYFALGGAYGDQVICSSDVLRHQLDHILANLGIVKLDIWHIELERAGLGYVIF